MRRVELLGAHYRYCNEKDMDCILYGRELAAMRVSLNNVEEKLNKCDITIRALHGQVEKIEVSLLHLDTLCGKSSSNS